MGGVLFYTCKAVIVVKEKIAPNRTCSLGQNQKERKRTYFAAKMTPIPNRVYIKRGRMGVRFFMQQMLRQERSAGVLAHGAPNLHLLLCGSGNHGSRFFAFTSL